MVACIKVNRMTIVLQPSVFYFIHLFLLKVISVRLSVLFSKILFIILSLCTLCFFGCLISINLTYKLKYHFQETYKCHLLYIILLVFLRYSLSIYFILQRIILFDFPLCIICAAINKWIAIIILFHLYCWSSIIPLRMTDYEIHANNIFLWRLGQLLLLY